MEVFQYQVSLFPKNLDFSNPSGFITEVAMSLKDRGVVFDSQQILPYQSLDQTTGIVTTGQRLIANASKVGLEIQADAEKIAIILSQLSENTEPDFEEFTELISSITGTDTLKSEIFKRVGFIKICTQYIDDFSQVGKNIFSEKLGSGLTSFSSTLEYKTSNSKDYLNVVLIVSSIIKLPSSKKAVQIITDVSTPKEGKRLTTDRFPDLLLTLSDDSITDGYISAMRINNGKKV